MSYERCTKQWVATRDEDMIPAAKRARKDAWLPSLNESARTMLVREFFHTRRQMSLEVVPPRTDGMKVTIDGLFGSGDNTHIWLYAEGPSVGEPQCVNLDIFTTRTGQRIFQFWVGPHGTPTTLWIRAMEIQVQCIVDHMRRPEALTIALRPFVLPPVIERCILPYLDPTEGVRVFVQTEADVANERT